MKFKIETVSDLVRLFSNNSSPKKAESIFENRGASVCGMATRRRRLPAAARHGSFVKIGRQDARADDVAASLVFRIIGPDCRSVSLQDSE